MLILFARLLGPVVPAPRCLILLAGLLAPHLAFGQGVAPPYLVQPLPPGGNTAGPADGVRAERPWARATAPQQKVGGAYVTLTSPADDRLLGASSPAAGRVEVHEMRMDGNVMRMRELADGVPLPAGKAVAFAPGGYHIMLMDLKQPLAAGQTVSVRLRFQNAPPLDLQVPVAPIGAQGPGTPSGTEGHAAMPRPAR